MRPRPLSRTGIQVSSSRMGTMRFGRIDVADDPPAITRAAA
ncbi:hypothetical protein ACWEPC_38525 [Nonomuraea sp. NPDC004297]